MKDQNKVVENSQQLNVYEKQTDSTPPQFLTSHHIAQLWVKMTMIYSHKWSSHAEADDGTWLQGLRGLSPAQVAHGLSMLIKNFISWPPSLPEFKKLCIGADDEELEQHIQEYAFKEFDSYYINQMSQDKRDSAIRLAKEPATKDYLDKKLNDAVNANIEQARLHDKR